MLKPVVAFALVLSPFAASGQWRTTPRPVLDIAGSVSSDSVVLEVPMGATRLSDGTVVVADGPSGRVKFFGADGRWLRTVGRKGRGPGEFGGISWLGQCGRDSAFAWDFTAQRLSAITATGGIARQTRIPSDPTKALTPFSIACSRSGLMALLGWPGPGRGGGPYTRGVASVTVTTMMGEIVLQLGDVPGTEFVAPQCLGGAAPRPLGKSTSIAVSRDFVFVGTGDSASVDIYPVRNPGAGSAQTRTSVKFASVRRAPNRRDLEAATIPFLSYVPAGPMRERSRECILSVPPPDQAPPYTGIFTDSEGTLWIQTSFGSDPDTRLLAMSPTGQRLGDLVIPRALMIYEIGTDYVLGRYDTPGGEPHIVLYRYTRTR